MDSSGLVGPAARPSWWFHWWQSSLVKPASFQRAPKVS